MGTGWLTCIPAVLLPHSPCRSTTANAPAYRQMPIASVVSCHSKKRKKTDLLAEKSLTNCPLYDINRRSCNDRLRSYFNFCLADNSSQIFKEGKTRKRLLIHVTTITTKNTRKLKRLRLLTEKKQK